MNGLAPSGRMRFIAVAAILCVGYFCPTAFAHPRGEWTKLIVTRHWPQTFCSTEQCTTNLSYWTLHGLWPNTGMRCNTSWHFNASLIEDLIPEMEKYWPDLLAPSSPKFWQYEWIKHGTCAAKADSLNSQHKYFSKALELNLKYDLNSVLKNNKIIPSEEYYTLDQVETAITSFFGVKPKIQCVHPGKGGQVQTLGQIELCVDRDFQLIDCEKSTKEIWSNAIPEVLVGGQSDLSVCDHSMPVYYPPVPSRS
ncbi:ribonuclease T2 [Sinocyclocheilus grahami]|uniref:Ribonuclease T2-like n=1 Tax=Sinocyclocheilus grahami TaxID=75366 RepID=A0A672TCN1_SINGR|nr:PREDICTED: ribonuclease T2-like [Sinocyclocheilus grahami]XP_016106924.1 PREDICTED: ribonuclease T2-like [Sinocyclocheilus grahami]